ncbi:MAG: Tfp pilus assembly protein FimT/FimU, partial [Pirellula sp.]
MSLKHRFALTLIELLVTLAVVSSLALLILPSVKSLLLDRKSSQSAIVVKNYLEAARSRAIASGKPVAVVLER